MSMYAHDLEEEKLKEAEHFRRAEQFRREIHGQAPIVFLPLMTKPAKSPFEGIKYLPDMWKPTDG